MLDLSEIEKIKAAAGQEDLFFRNWLEEVRAEWLQKGRHENFFQGTAGDPPDRHLGVHDVPDLRHRRDA